MEFVDQPWFYWALSVAIGLLALTELAQRTGSAR